VLPTSPDSTDALRLEKRLRRTSAPPAGEVSGQARSFPLNPASRASQTTPLQGIPPSSLPNSQFSSSAFRKYRSEKMKILWMWVGQVQNGYR
jgi:hypothetical protein